jgi:hypothetical protein
MVKLHSAVISHQKIGANVGDLRLGHHHRDAPQSYLLSSDSRSQGMVGSREAKGENLSYTRVQGVPQYKLKLSYLVSAVELTAQVVALYVELIYACIPRQVVKLLHWGGESAQRHMRYFLTK